MAAKLIVTSGNETKEYDLGEAPVTIGRDLVCTVILNDPIISRQHTRIEIKKGRVIVTDLGSSNGTRVNGKRITTTTLADGDVITISASRIVYKETKKQAPPVDDLADSKVEVQESAEILHKSLMFSTNALDQSPPGTKRKEMMFSILFHVGKAVSSASTLDDMIEKAMEMVFFVIEAERGVVMIKQEGTGKLVSKMAYHRYQDQFAATDLRVSSTIINKAMLDKMAIITSNAMTDPRFLDGRSIAEMSIRSAICVPLWDEGEVFGIMYLDNMALNHQFNNDDLVLLNAIGNLIAIRLRHEKLNDKLRQETMRRNNLAKYHSPDVVDLLMSQNEDASLSMGERTISVLFVDVANSTPLAEQITPGSFASMLNDFLDLATSAIFEHHGHVNKFIGDCVMAVFNAPADVKDHAAMAVAAAMKIVRNVEARNKDPKTVHRYDVRIGINTGRALVGNVGSEQRREYTVIGDVVNTASRLSKAGGLNEVIISQDTFTACGQKIAVESMGEVALKGKEKPFALYKVLEK